MLCGSVFPLKNGVRIISTLYDREDSVDVKRMGQYLVQSKLSFNMSSN